MSPRPAPAEQVSRLIALFLKGRGVERIYA